MKSIYLYITFLLFPFLTAWGQVEIYYGVNSTTNVAGEEVEIILYGQEAEGYFYFKNISDRATTYKVTRVQLAPVDFQLREQLCVGGPSGNGNCYILDSDNEIYQFPTDIYLNINEKGMIEYIFDNYAIPAHVNNRYIVSDISGNKIDSVDIKATATLSTNNITPNTASVNVSSYPNPASDLLNIKVTGSEENTIKIIDVLGNVVYSGRMSNDKKVDVSNLNNGVYILKVDATNGKNLQSKKIIIRH